jgi:rare lipoprotein A
MAGRQAATLYVRNIPVLTFLAASPVATSSQKDGSTNDGKVATNSSQIKVATKENLPVSTQASSGTNDDLQAKNAPVWRATAVAAKINQMSVDNVDAAKVTVSWKAGDNSAAKAEERYSIKVNDEELVEINAETRLPDQTKSLAEDALQVTNRLRRQLGSASPLREIAGMPKPQLPKPPQQIASSVRARLSGMASWYGPGFHGNRTASGEVYNQHALTAAHRSLPFGTRVRVTNTRTGRSVVVRITDRGPFIGGRVLDLSAAAARMLGVVQAGIAPVQLEVLN